MKKLLFLLAGPVLSSCAVTLMPQTAQVPVLLEKGAVEARASTGLNGSEVQTAWAVTNHLAVLGGGLYSRRHFGSGELGADQRLVKTTELRRSGSFSELERCRSDGAPYVAGHRMSY